MSPRFKTESAEAVYHCISYLNNGIVLDTGAREVLRQHLWRNAEFCGVQILTYVIMPDHFRVLVRVPAKTDVPDAELLRRHKVLYPKPSASLAAILKGLPALLKTNDPVAAAWRKQQLGRMHNVSQFMKFLKQHFSRWLNRAHNCRGTAWSERFKSVIVEDRADVLTTMSAYLDLTPVRAGLADNPKDYPYCGYAEALNGNKSAQAGIIYSVTGGQPGGTWRDAHEAYRLSLFGDSDGDGAKQRADKEVSVTPARLEKAMKGESPLPLAGVLRREVRHFTDGGVIGGKEFVARHLARYQRKTGLRKHLSAQALPPVTEWGDIAAMRNLRKNAIK